jgi:hypothetical protein
MEIFKRGFSFISPGSLLEHCVCARALNMPVSSLFSSFHVPGEGGLSVGLVSAFVRVDGAEVNFQYRPGRCFCCIGSSLHRVFSIKSSFLVRLLCQPTFNTPLLLSPPHGSRHIQLLYSRLLCFRRARAPPELSLSLSRVQMLSEFQRLFPTPALVAPSNFVKTIYFILLLVCARTLKTVTP